MPWGIGSIWAGWRTVGAGEISVTDDTGGDGDPGTADHDWACPGATSTSTALAAGVGPRTDRMADLGGHRGDAPADADDAGMSTVEYAVGTVVAAAFAAVLYRIVTGDSVVDGLTNLINSAFSTSF